MFVIQKDNLGKTEKYVLRNELTGEYLNVIPRFGANINELVLKHNCELHSVIDGESDIESLKLNERYASRILIPFANRIKDGAYTFEGHVNRLEINHIDENHAIHGLLFNKEFRVSSLTENEKFASIELMYLNDNDSTGYPFKFKVNLTISLNLKGLKYQTKLTNTGSKNMPVGAGWHPYFTFHEQVNDLLLHLPESREIIVDERMIPTGKKIKNTRFLSPTKIDDTKLDTGFHIDDLNTIVTTRITSINKKVKINVWQETGLHKYNFLQIYIPPDRKSIGIEPMTSNTDSFNNKDGLIILQPGERFKASCGVYLS